MGLLVAASQIKTDFQSTIEVNYTIRKEAFACEENLLGQNSKKTLNNYVELYYSKEEQRKIFYECIGNQDPDYLFEPSLAKMDGMEEEAFVGVKTLCHPYNLALSESVFDSIFRHSFDRAHYNRSKDFYVNKLGFSVIRENYRPERNDWKSDLQCGNIELEIFGVSNPPARVSHPEAAKM